MRRDWDAIVLGLGGLGSGAAYWLARRLGAGVLGLEQFELGHERGGSQDHSRIIRLSYHTPAYVRLAHRAYEAWADLEGEAREELVVVTGGLDLFPPAAAIPSGPYVESLDTCAAPYELLDGAEVRRRWPAFRVGDEVIGLYQEHGGWVRAARANAAHQRLAREHGACLEERTAVLEVREAGGEIDVATDRGTFRCGRLVVCAGAWTNRALSGLGVVFPLTVTQEQVVYLKPVRPELFTRGRFPIWIWMDDPSFYGFPLDEPGLKLAQDVGGRQVTAESRSFEPDPENLARVLSFAERVLPEGAGELRSVKTCLYDLTPDRDLVLDRVPGCANVFLALGAAHAFKFASAIGRILADLAVDGSTAADVTAFSATRPILGEPDPPKSFLV
jgi:sarcosine oxidase